MKKEIDKNMRRRRRQGIAKVHPGCPNCGRRVETETVVRTASGESRKLSAEPGDLTGCECGKMLEYHDHRGKMTVKLASTERVQAFRALEREGPAPRQLSAVVEYVRTFHSMPPGKLPRVAATSRFAISRRLRANLLPRLN